MSGIYVHIPFCKKACHYCNFHFSTSLKLQEDMVDSICQEIAMRKDYLQDKLLQSIYFGGGTPSLLTGRQLDAIIHQISLHFEIAPKAEITLEANPDDLNKNKLLELKSAGINRLSIGIQSFYDKDLEWMNRSHNSFQSHQCIEDSYNTGIENLSIDLIFGSPTTDLNAWQTNLEIAARYHIRHLSCYGLTVENGTALADHINKGKTPPPDESLGFQQFEMAMAYLESRKYEQYEISNYCLPGYEAIHNSNYWKQSAYLGIGPSAHSFNGISRQWNVSNNVKYIHSIKSKVSDFEQEMLTKADIFNEYILTGLRTKWGCRIEKLQQIDNEYYRQFSEQAKVFTTSQQLMLKDDCYVLTRQGKSIADRLISDLFITNE